MPYSSERRENFAFCIRIDGVIRPAHSTEINNTANITYLLLGRVWPMHAGYMGVDLVAPSRVPLSYHMMVFKSKFIPKSSGNCKWTNFWGDSSNEMR